MRNSSSLLCCSRRAFVLGALGTGAAIALGAKVSLPVLASPKTPYANGLIFPPGGNSFASFSAKCTGCQLCVAACPHNVLRSSDQGAGLLQPALSFTHGYCQPDCVACSEVCPTGALLPILPRVKRYTQIGIARFKRELCEVVTHGTNCTECAQKCPEGAIMLVDDGGLRLPRIDEYRCNGCGACEHFCPVKGEVAISVEGLPAHERI